MWSDLNCDPLYNNLMRLQNEVSRTRPRRDVGLCLTAEYRNAGHNFAAEQINVKPQLLWTCLISIVSLQNVNAATLTAECLNEESIDRDACLIRSASSFADRL